MKTAEETSKQADTFNNSLFCRRDSTPHAYPNFTESYFISLFSNASAEFDRSYCRSKFPEDFDSFFSDLWHDFSDQAQPDLFFSASDEEKLSKPLLGYSDSDSASEDNYLYSKLALEVKKASKPKKPSTWHDCIPGYSSFEFPCKKSILSKEEMTNCFEIIKVIANFQNPSEEQYEKLRVFKARIEAEQQAFLELAQEYWRRSFFVRHQEILPQVESFVNSLWQKKLEEVRCKPRFYINLLTIPLCPKSQEDVEMKFISNLHNIGKGPPCYFPVLKKFKVILNSYIDDISQQYESDKKKSVKELEFESAQMYHPKVSQDKLGEQLAVKYSASIVMSASSFLCLIDNHPPFINRWHIPFTVKEHAIGQKKKIIIYFDKPLAPESMSQYERKEKYFKVATNQAFSNLKSGFYRFPRNKTVGNCQIEKPCAGRGSGNSNREMPTNSAGNNNESAASEISQKSENKLLSSSDKDLDFKFNENIKIEPHKVEEEYEFQDHATDSELSDVCSTSCTTEDEMVIDECQQSSSIDNVKSPTCCNRKKHFISPESPLKASLFQTEKSPSQNSFNLKRSPHSQGEGSNYILPEKEVITYPEMEFASGKNSLPELDRLSGTLYTEGAEKISNVGSNKSSSISTDLIFSKSSAETTLSSDLVKQFNISPRGETILSETSPFVFKQYVKYDEFKSTWERPEKSLSYFDGPETTHCEDYETVMSTFIKSEVADYMCNFTVDEENIDSSVHFDEIDPKEAESKTINSANTVDVTEVEGLNGLQTIQAEVTDFEVNNDLFTMSDVEFGGDSTVEDRELENIISSEKEDYSSLMRSVIKKDNLEMKWVIEDHLKIRTDFVKPRVLVHESPLSYQPDLDNFKEEVKPAVIRSFKQETHRPLLDGVKEDIVTPTITNTMKQKVLCPPVELPSTDSSPLLMIAKTLNNPEEHLSKFSGRNFSMKKEVMSPCRENISNNVSCAILKSHYSKSMNYPIQIPNSTFPNGITESTEEPQIVPFVKIKTEDVEMIISEFDRANEIPKVHAGFFVDSASDSSDTHGNYVQPVKRKSKMVYKGPFWDSPDSSPPVSNRFSHVKNSNRRADDGNRIPQVDGLWDSPGDVEDEDISLVRRKKHLSPGSSLLKTNLVVPKQTSELPASLSMKCSIPASYMNQRKQKQSKEVRNSSPSSSKISKDNLVQEISHNSKSNCNYQGCQGITPLPSRISENAPFFSEESCFTVNSLPNLKFSEVTTLRESKMRNEDSVVIFDSPESPQSDRSVDCLELNTVPLEEECHPEKSALEMKNTVIMKSREDDLIRNLAELPQWDNVRNDQAQNKFEDFETLLSTYSKKRNHMEWQTNVSQDWSSQRVTYNMWKLHKSVTSILSKNFSSDINLLIRCKDGHRRRDGKMMKVAVKSEYQSELGAEQVSLSEITRQWASVIIRPNTDLLRVRVNAVDSEVIQYQQLTSAQLTHEANRIYRTKLSERLASFQAVLEGIINANLAPGNYLLSHKDPAFATVHSPKDTSGYSLSLHTNYSWDARTVAPERKGWVPLDTLTLTPKLEHTHRLPATFIPPKKMYSPLRRSALRSLGLGPDGQVDIKKKIKKKKKKKTLSGGLKKARQRYQKKEEGKSNASK